ncbi:ATP-binding protein [Nonomuraea fuscirosea]|uniref:ATP-binding protein n=1 Tax=Nonomuraea fuscirosea TaxID=1291556 RepID=UPI00372456E0
MTSPAPTPDGREDQYLLRQARARQRGSDEVPPAELGVPTWLENLSPEVRAKAAAGLARARDNVVQLPGQPGTECACPRPGNADYRPQNLGKCPACQQAREDNRAEVLALQRQFRLDIWQRCLRDDFADYANAALSDLKPEQNPDGKVTGWLDSDARTLILAGENSRGKTHCAFAIGNHAAHERGMWVIAWNAADFHDAIRPGGDPRAYEYAELCDVLVYDDMGAEKMSEAVRKTTYQLLDRRVRNLRKTVLATNLPYDERGFADTPVELRPVRPNLVELYGGRIAHRLLQEAIVARITGDSWRKPAPW